MTRILPPAYLTFREAVTGRLGPAAISAPGPLLLGGLNGSTQHFIFESKDGV
jgi:hypothetical protein